MRKVFQQAVKHVLGFEFDLEQLIGLADEPADYVFTNNARSLNMDATTFERYYDAAEAALAQLFEDENGSWFMAGWQVMNKRRKEAKAAREALLAEAEGRTGGEGARLILQKTASRAFRRPMTDEQTNKLLGLFERELASGGSFTDGLRKALYPILTSPLFLFRMETQDAESSEPYEPVSDYELATRLSYFLWAAPPDEELLKLAKEGKLAGEDTLTAQVERLLKDQRAETLSTIFGSQWTQLHHLKKALPERRHFSRWTPEVREAMHGEVIAFFEHLRLEDRPVTDLIASGYTFVNPELAALYGLPKPGGDGLKKVSLPSESPRGGLMSMGAYLAMTSHTSRTKPTARGKWILDVMFGTPPPPPPANVEALEDQAGKHPDAASLSFRDQLNRHASDANCRACHERIDPLGFALENFNGVGEWRDKDGDRTLDTKGVLPSGCQLQGVADLKEVLLEDKDRFTANLARQLLSYALGRHLVFTDELAINEATRRAASSDYRYSALIQGIVHSRPFLMKRTRQGDDAMAKNSFPPENQPSLTANP